MQKNFERAGIVVDSICPTSRSKGRGMSESRQRRLEEGGHESAVGALGRTEEDVRAGVANPFHVLTT